MNRCWFLQVSHKLPPPLDFYTTHYTMIANLLTFSQLTEDPAEQVFDTNMDNVNSFLQRIAKFEMNTNS